MMRRLTVIGGTGLLLVGLAFLLRGGVIDDAYIFCRYAENLVSSNGLVFNPGERVEGVTSLAHTLLVASGIASGMDGPSAARFGSTTAALAVLVLLVAGFRHAPAVGGGAALLTAATTPFVMWSSSGMDACLFAAVTLASTLCAGRDMEDERVAGLPRRTTWLLAGSAFLVRPEGLVVIGAIGLTALPALIRRRHDPSTWIGPLFALIPVAGLTAFRVVYFGQPLPNTFYAKVGGGSLDLWLRGLQYGVDVAVTLAPLILLAALGWRHLKRSATLRVQAVTSTLLVLGTIYSGGDAFPLARLAVPIIPLLAAMATTNLLRRVRSAPWFAVSVGLVALATFGWTMNPPVPFATNFGHQGFAFHRLQAATWDQVGRDLRARFGEDRSIALSPVGAIPYRSKWRTIDMLGLIDLHTAHLDVRLGRGYPGHEKFDPEYVLDRRPDIILLHTFLFPEPVAPEVANGALAMDAERAMLQNPRFLREYRFAWVETSLGYLAAFVRANELPSGG